MKTLLQLSGITKSFGAVRALKGVSFDLCAGEVHALLGENGAGKSTLIKVITGAHAPEAGVIEIEGQPVTALTPARAHGLGIACIYQQPVLFPDLTVAENLALRLEPVRSGALVNWPARRQVAEQLLGRIGAEFSPEAEVRSLSMPEQQLVEIAAALGAGARIVIMDEPTASLTQKEQQLLFGVVRELRQSGVGVIYISHRLEEIFTLADRVTVLRDGASVGTSRVGELTEASLIQRMVGREVSQRFPPAEGLPGEAVLSLKKVGYGQTVHSVTLEVRAGEVVGLSGLMGAGRTELARILFGLTPADAGEIHFQGRLVTVSSPEEAIALGIAYVPEDRRRQGVIFELPISTNITLASHRRLFPGGWLRRRSEQAVTLKFLRDLAVKAAGPDALVSSLSGGNQQKVALARWLATQPRLLILDEPTQGVDVGAKAEIHRIIRRLAGQGLAVLLISSDLPEILGMSDRIVVMRGGAVVATLVGRQEAPVVMAAALGQRELKGSPKATAEGGAGGGAWSRWGASVGKFPERSVWGVLLVLLGLLALMAPSFFEPQPLLSRLTAAAPKLVLAGGLALVIIGRQIDISVGSLFAVSSVCAGWLASSVPFPLVVCGALGVGAAGGALNGVLVAGLRLPSIVVTLATMVTLREALRLAQQGVFVNLPEGVQWFGLSMRAGQATVCGLALGLFVLLAWGMKRLSVGRWVYALGSEAEAARLAGLRPQRVTFLVFVLMGGLAGLAAVLNLVQSPQVDPSGGRGLELEAIAAVVVGGVAVSGGRGRLGGVLAGLLLLVSIGPALTYAGVPPYWEKAIQGAIILLAVVADVRRRRELRAES